MAHIRYLLLQVRDATDPMRQQEVESFARALECDRQNIEVADLLAGWPDSSQLHASDVIFLGGSGDYSAAGEASDWLTEILDGLRELSEMAKPTFASCWGFQAIARALGGRCVHDPKHAELGNVELQLTAAGKEDPLFGQLPVSFLGHGGHEDHVTELPDEAVLLASTDSVTNQAFRMKEKPIYCTQFHPELNRTGLLTRLQAYPSYVEKIAGISYKEFEVTVCETPESNLLLKKFVDMVSD